MITQIIEPQSLPFDSFDFTQDKYAQDRLRAQRKKFIRHGLPKAQVTQDSHCLRQDNKTNKFSIDKAARQGERKIFLNLPFNKADILMRDSKVLFSPQGGKVMSTKRVFILGAGFSKDAGLPLATELTEKIIKSEGLKDLENFQQWAKQLIDEINKVEKCEDVNIEQFFDYAQSYKTRQNGTDAYIEYMEEDLAYIICCEQKKANYDYIKQFANHLTKDDNVITFNYDTLVESALSEKKKEWNHGLLDRNKGGITILKMHGSIDWFIFEPINGGKINEGKERIKLFSKEGTEGQELWRTKNYCSLLDRKTNPPQNQIKGNAGLGSNKKLHNIPGSAKTWANAFRALRQAEQIYVVGFSMSPYDTLARFFFSICIQDRDKPPDKITVINPEAKDKNKADEIKTNFTTIFGNNINLIGEKAKDVVWDDILKSN